VPDHGQIPEAPGDSGSTELDAAIAALWRDARPRALERVEVIERAAAALRRGDLSAELEEDARRDAHKLAGALGTFGMPDGTTHARAIELLLEGGATSRDVAEIEEHLAPLRAIVTAGAG
jgi:HPt (histidine-containing phosphotransfer) domain-containing protein